MYKIEFYLSDHKECFTFRTLEDALCFLNDYDIREFSINGEYNLDIKPL